VAGHSYGGQIMTALGADTANVAGLVYVAAFALDEGERSADAVAGPAHAGAGAHEYRRAGFAWLSEEDFVNHFEDDVDRAKRG